MAGKWRTAEPSFSWLSSWIGAAFLISIAHAGQPTLTLRDRPDISVVMDIQPNSCSAAVPITIQSSKESDFRDGSKILGKVMAWAQVTVSTNCADTNAIQLTGIVSGQTIYQGKAERTNDWTLFETRLEQSSFPPHLRHSATSRTVSSRDNTIYHPAEKSREIKRDKTSNNEDTQTSSTTTDVSGRWTGTTLCPSGPISFTIDVQGSKGTFSYGAKKDQRSHPINVSTMKGWEGMWINFFPAESNYHGSFQFFNGLLSSDGRNLTVRAGVGLGDCRGFTLTRREIPSIKSSSKVTGPPQGREPTEEEMRAAVEYSLHGDAESLKINNPLSGATASIDHFEKLNCEPHKTKPGYFCDYIMSTNVQFHSNEGTEAGRKHAQGVQLMYEMFKGNSNAPDAVVSSRFLYVKSKNRWMKFNN